MFYYYKSNVFVAHNALWIFLRCDMRNPIVSALRFNCNAHWKACDEICALHVE